MRYCSQCGKTIRVENIYCPHCGSYNRTCPHCFSAISFHYSKNSQYCPFCGQPIRVLGALAAKWGVKDVFTVAAITAGIGIIASIFVILLLLVLVPGPFISLITGTSLPDGTSSIFGLIILVFSILFYGSGLITTHYYVRRRGSSFEAMGLNKANSRLLALGVLLGVGSFVLSEGIGIILLPLMGTSPVNEQLSGLVRSPLIFAVFLLVGAMIAPFAEEMFFRGFAYSAFRNRWGNYYGTLASAVMFAVVHLDPWSFLPILMIGVIFAYVYGRTGSLPIVMVAHGTFNALAFATIWSF